LVYDPSGSFNPRDNDGNPLKGEDDTVSGNYCDAFIKFQKADGPDVQTYTFPTTHEEEEKIRQNIDKEPYGGKWPHCARAVRDVSSGVGSSFKNLAPGSWYSTPKGLGSDLQKIQGK
jgi:hypothetical protein